MRPELPHMLVELPFLYLPESLQVLLVRLFLIATYTTHWYQIWFNYDNEIIIITIIW